MGMDRTVRQARSQATKFRAVEDSGARFIEGYFAVFGAAYEIWKGATESVDSHAFDDTLGDDIRALIDHETRLVLGRNKSSTLELKVDSHGLWGRAKINESDVDATNLYARVERGDVDQCSFGFDILDEEIDYHEDGSIHWTIKKVKLYEVSVVTFPAYEDTSVTARKKDYNQIRARQTQAWKARQKERIKHHGT
jgi:HK97 family phage prohead protease